MSSLSTAPTLSEGHQRNTACALAVGLALCVSLAPPALAADPEPRHLQLADYLDYERVSDPQLSPDGDKIVYTRRWVDKIHDR